MSKLVTLITPTYRAEPFIREYLQSVLDQTYAPLEFILVNDGSDDNSEAIINAFAAQFKNRGIIFKYLRQEHKGQAAAFNLALAQVSGEYLTWADSDDILHHDNIRLKMEYMDTHDNCRMLRCNAREFDDNTRTELRHSARPEDKTTRDIFADLVNSSTYCLAGCYMLQTALFRECYPDMRIPESPVGQNLQMLLPPASRVVCHYIDAPLLSYRRHANSHYHHSLRSWRNRLDRARAHALLLKALVPYCVNGKERLAICEPEKHIFAKLRAGLVKRYGNIAVNGEDGP